MAESIKILRRSFHAFLRSYHFFASAAALLAVPYSVATLLSQSTLPTSSSLLRAVSSRLWLLFEASGFPSSHFVSLLNVKLSQALFSFITTLPFNATFLLLAKTCVFHVVQAAPPPPGRRRAGSWLPPLGPLLRLYPSLLLTHLFNSFFVLSANAAVLALLFVAFSVIDFLGATSSGLTLAVSVAGVILYSLALANALVTCNMAMAVAAMENYGGHLAVLEALVLVQGRMAVAVTLALSASLGVATIEALFHCRVVRPYVEYYLMPQPPALQASSCCLRARHVGEEGAEQRGVEEDDDEVAQELRGSGRGGEGDARAVGGRRRHDPWRGRPWSGGRRRGSGPGRRVGGRSGQSRPRELAPAARAR